VGGVNGYVRNRENRRQQHREISPSGYDRSPSSDMV